MTQEQQQTAVNRGSAGRLGKGTPGKRLKNSWRAGQTGGSLRSFVRSLGNAADALAWLMSKRPSGIPKKERPTKAVQPSTPTKGKARK